MNPYQNELEMSSVGSINIGTTHEKEEKKMV